MKLDRNYCGSNVYNEKFAFPLYLCKNMVELVQCEGISCTAVKLDRNECGSNVYHEKFALPFV